MKTYTEEEVKELVKQAVDLKIPLYKGTKIGDIEMLIRHKLAATYDKEIPVN